jgi:hypothetical protein
MFFPYLHSGAAKLKYAKINPTGLVMMNDAYIGSISCRLFHIFEFWTSNLRSFFFDVKVVESLSQNSWGSWGVLTFPKIRSEKCILEKKI